MDETYDALATRVLQKWTEKKSSHGDNARLLIALAGPPGSGKSTIAELVAERVRASPSAPSILVIPADGFHLPLSTLRSLPNAAEALACRGAPWTFDAAATATLVRCLRNGKEAVNCPTFDHAVKDPVADGLTVGPDIQVCLVEGNYLLSDEGPWEGISRLVDDRWLVEVDSSLARKRVALRHLQAGIEGTMEGALKRADENDVVNGKYVALHSRGRQDVTVQSIEAGR